MAVKVGVQFDPVVTQKVDAALARIRSQAKGVNFGDGARSLEKLSRPLGRITGQASEFQKSLEASNARVLAFGASVAVINKLSQAFGALVANTIKIEASFAKINTILGGTEQELRQFGDGIFRVAQNTATSFDQVAEGALELARQGLSVEESLSRVETALKLVRVAGIDSQQAVAGLTAAIKGFESSGITVTDIADKLAEVDTKFAVSTEDLINGLERASASARVAGVSFDELLGVITTVQERTQRGGAVIGNAFKTIFARLGRTDTLAALEELGIQVLDSEGNVRSAIPLFKELAAELDRLGLKSIEAGEVIQKVAGVRQRDILISLVEDLNSTQSQFAKSLQVSAGATGALDQKNKALNDTLEALINNLVVGSQKLSSVLGELGFADAAKDILRLFSSVVNGITDLLQGDSIGAKFAQGIITGIGSILTGPGLALVGAIFTKLFIDLAKFGSQSLKQILGINRAAEQQRILQQSVLQTLLQNENIQREILALEGNKVAQEQLLLRIYNQQAAALARVQKAAATVSPGLFRGGFRGGEGGVTRRSADGYISAEARDVSRGVGGATASSKVVSIPNFAFGRGQRGTMVANTSEYYVPNYSGGGDAIVNKDMVRTMGLPSGAKKLNASGGFIPNFAAPAAFVDFMRSKGLSPRSRELGAARSTNFDNAYKGGTYREQFDSLSPLDQRNISKAAAQRAQLRRSKDAKGRSKFGIMYSDVVGGTPSTNLLTPGKNTIKAIPIDTQPPNKLYSDLRESMVNSAVKFAQTLGFRPDIIQDNKFKRAADRSLNPGSVESAFGTVFEAAFQGALGIPQKSNAIFDLPTPTAIQSLISRGKSGGIIEKISGNLAGLMAVDVKNALNIDNLKSIDNKIKNTGASRRKAAFGYIPNFAMSPIDEAIERERSAGIPISQIRINQSGKLRNSQNPDGIAVTNTRDEPTGRIPNFIRKSEKLGLGKNPVPDSGPGTATIAASSEKLNKSLDGSITKFFALQLALGGLTSVIGSTEKDASGLQKAFASLGSSAMSAVNALLVASTVGINPFGATKIPEGASKGVAKALTSMGKFGTILGPVVKLFGTLVRFAGPIGLGLFAVNAGLKALTGGGILSLFGVGVKDATEALGDFKKSLKDESAFELQKRLDAAEERDANLKANREIFQKTLDAVPTTGIDKRNSSAVQRELTDQEKFFKSQLEGTGEFKEVGSLDKRIKQNEEIIKLLRELIGETAEGQEAAGGAPSGTMTGRTAAERLRITGAVQAGERAVAGVANVFAPTNRNLETQKVTLGERLKDAEGNEIQAGATGDRLELLEQELKLAKAVSTEDKVNAQNAIAQLKFDIDARKERFQISKDFAKNIKEVSTVSEEQLEIIGEQVRAGNDLNQIQQALKEAGQDLNQSGQNALNIDIARLRTLNLRLEAQQDEIDNQKEINNLQNAGTFGEGFNEGLGQLRDEIAFFEERLGREIPNLFATNLGTAMKDAISGAKDLGDALRDAARGFLEKMRDNFIDQAARQATDFIMGFGQQLAPKIGDVVTSLAEKSPFESGAAGAEKSSGGVGGFISSLFGGDNKGAKQGATASNPLYVSDVANQVGGGGNPAQKAIEQLTGEGEGGEQGFFSKMKDSFGNIFGELKTKFGDLFGGLKDSLGGIFKGLGGAMGGIGGGLGGMLGGLGGGLGGIFSSVLGGLTGGLGGLGGILGGFLGFAKGGPVGSTDTVPAMLSPGEFVVRKSAVDRYGTDFLSSLNRGLLPMQGFQNGGSVSPVASETGTGAGVGQVNNNSDFTFNIDQGGQVNQQGGEDSNRQQRDFAARVKEAVTTVVQEESRTGGTLNYLYSS